MHRRIKVKVSPITVAALGIALGSVATVMLSGKKIRGKKVTREIRNMACGLAGALPTMGRTK